MKFSVVSTFLAVNLALVSATYIPRQTGGTQFITGPCQSDSDCQSGCCGFNTGKCAGPVVAQERDGGCGFGDQSPNDNAAKALQGNNNGAANNGAANNAANNGNTTTGTGSGKPPGTQFITGQCASDAECASGCCGFNTGKCAGPVVAQERDGGCGFGDQSPNDNAAKALQGGGNNNNAANNAVNATNNAANNNSNNAANNSGSGKAPGTQFITGQCANDAECASGCCGFNTGKCAGPVIAQERDGGCGFGDASPNDKAAQAFRAGQSRRHYHLD